MHLHSLVIWTEMSSLENKDIFVFYILKRFIGRWEMQGGFMLRKDAHKKYNVS
jgi:hypothetical protein